MEFINSLAYELHQALVGIAMSKPAPGKPRARHFYFRALHGWWEANKAFVGGPGDLLRTIEFGALAGSPGWENECELTAPSQEEFAQVVRRFGELSIAAPTVVMVPAPQVAVPQAPAPKVAVQTEKPAPQEKPGKAPGATVEEVEIALGRLELSLDDDQVAKLTQERLVFALGEIGVPTTVRTIRETAWWKCRQDRRVGGMRRANDRAKVT